MSGRHHHGGALLRMGIVVGCTGARRRRVRRKGILVAGRGRHRRSSLVGRMRRSVGRQSPRRAQLDSQRRPRRHARLQRRGRMYVSAGRAVIQAWMGSLLLARRHLPGRRSVRRRSVVVDDRAQVHGCNSRLRRPRGRWMGPFRRSPGSPENLLRIQGSRCAASMQFRGVIDGFPRWIDAESSGCFDFSLVLRYAVLASWRRWLAEEPLSPPHHVRTHLPDELLYIP